MESIDKHIEYDKKLLDDPTTSPQSRRHTEEELEALQAYKQNHPDNTSDPTALELYCDSNPSAPECKKYDV
jgi:hypothetical protein